ncbi:HAUS augmin-like complex subunit 5 [Apodemus speciosus]|uniref:HAUS augmin-like complex subunit 5 n=1 Tax=Apodemus speciosus TaxID=105296 RepID=A0ABQ0EXY8_APOSI
MRLCLGQGADIWAYVVQHVRSQRNIKMIQGNLLWYGHQDNPKIRRKLELEATVARLRAENQELDQSLELMDQKTEAQDVAMTQTLQSLKNTQHQALLLQAKAGAVRRQKRGLQDPKQRLQNQLTRLQDMQRKAQVDVTFGPVVSAAPALEPQVLADVRAACSLRTQFLQNLLTPQARGGSILSPCDDHVGTSYQQWLTSVEMLTNHPAGHILAALEHLAAERESEIRSLCYGDGLKEEELSRPQARDSSDSSQVLPSTAHLIQRSALLSERQVLTGRLQGLVEEVERLSLESSKRKALLLGLRHSGLWAALKALHAQTQELESAVERRQLLLRELQAKRQQILQWRQLVEERQEQIRLLIKGNSASKTRLSRGPEEVLSLIRQKLVPASEAVAPQSQELLRCLKEEAKHLPHVLLGPLLPYHVKGAEAVIQDSTIHPSAAPHYPKGLQAHLAESHTGTACRESIRTTASKGCLAPTRSSVSPRPVGSPRRRSLCEDQCASGTIHPGELLQTSQEKEQNENMGQTLKKLSNLLKQALEQIPELQGIVEDWWEQPGQAALSEELRQGLSLRQWQLRWLQAQVALQQQYK